MKRISLLVAFIACAHLLVAQEQPVSNLHVLGNFSVRQSLVAAKNPPAAWQTSILSYTVPVYVSGADSTGRIKDHEGPPVNYSPNLRGRLFLYVDENPTLAAVQINFETFDLGEGDTLIIRSETGVELLKAGKNYPLDGTFSFNVLGMSFEFISNSDQSVGRGFSLVWRRLYRNPQHAPPSLPLGNAFVFNSVTGAVSSGKMVSLASGINPTAFGYESSAAGDYAQAFGYRAEAAGKGSMAGGIGSKAIGENSVAFGGGQALGTASMGIGYARASGNYSVALGANAHAAGLHAVALGAFAVAKGDHSLAAGTYTASPYYASVVFGRHNYTNGGNAASWDPKEPLLLVGNGISVQKPSNILEFYKNGRLQVSGSISQLADEDLKRDIKPIEGSLEKLSKIFGYHFYWKDAQLDQHLQTGLIANELKDKFPELVTENLKGDQSINYIGLIPHLINAINELKQQLNEKRGESKQADIAVCLCDNAQADRLSAYPNPTSNHMTVTISTEAAGNGSLKLYDANGRLIKQMNIAIRNGKNTIPVNLPGLAAGNYELIAEWGNGMKKQVSIVRQ